MITYQHTFQEEYKRLNAQQQQAVDTIEGPVMVLAGPGTGKTQILALRICNILMQTDAQPNNILCLTFTDQGAVEMRKRLIAFMGADAYKVHVFTYHAFAKKIIQENPDHFNNYLLEPLSDIERISVIREIIDGFEFGHILHRIKADAKYFDRKNFENLYQTMKKEGWRSEDLKAAMDKDLADKLALDPDYSYKTDRNGKKGDPNPKYFTLEKRYIKAKAALDTYDDYIHKLEKLNRFDYADMINWSIEALETNENIRLDYQEQYLYLLADEFQDSSGTQIDILNLLAKDVEQPNLFVVGDDDQSIYRFQGASMENLAVFNTVYNPKLIVLLNNYRSSTPIVEASKQLIASNQSRLTRTMQLDKNFIASGPHKDLDTEPEVLEFNNIIAEETYLYETIVKLRDEGKPLHEVAVLFPQHKIASELIKVLTKENIPVQVKRKVDLLKVPYINNILNILELINKLHKGDYAVDHLIPELLNLPRFNVDFTEVYKIGKYLSAHKDENWTDILMSKEKLSEITNNTETPLHAIQEHLSNWVSYVTSKTTQTVFQHIIEEGGFIDQALLANDNYWKLEMLNTLFDYIKDESVAKPDFSIDDLNTQIQIMSENDLSLDFVDVIGDSDGVQFVSCHGSKGMQFDQVFMIGCIDNNWKVKASQSGFKLPPMGKVVNINGDSDEEEKRRLWYVAMTRARKQLTFTYSIEDTESQKELTPASYIAELNDRCEIKTTQIKLPKEVITAYQEKRMTLPKLKSEHWIDEQIIRSRLENYVMNVTHVNKYLSCPITFYFEVILRVSSARTSNMGYGNAIHFALEKYIRQQYEAGPNSLGIDLLIKLYNEGLIKYSSHFTKREFEDYLKHGKQTLEKYYNQYNKEWLQPKAMHFEKKIDNVVINGVPFSGYVDRIDVHDTHVEVFDYKTGSQNYKKVKPPIEGDTESGTQWRQIIAYALLIEASPEFSKPMNKGYLDFTEGKEDKPLTRKGISPERTDLDQVAAEIRSVYDKITALEFHNGCQKDRCRWCRFVQT